MTKREELVREIKEIALQYNVEVPSGRRAAWPKSIRERVEELFRLGMSAKTVSVETGLAYFTVLNWKKRGGGFRALALSHSATATVPIVSSQNVATVTVTTASGLKIEGLNFEQLLVALERLQ